MKFDSHKGRGQNSQPSCWERSCTNLLYDCGLPEQNYMSCPASCTSATQAGPALVCQVPRTKPLPRPIEPMFEYCNGYLNCVWNQCEQVIVQKIHTERVSLLISFLSCLLHARLSRGPSLNISNTSHMDNLGLRAACVKRPTQDKAQTWFCRHCPEWKNSSN